MGKNQMNEHAYSHSRKKIKLTSDFVTLSDDKNSEGLLEDYVDNWVALKNGEVVCHAVSASELVRELLDLKMTGVVSQYVRRAEAS